MFSFRITIVPAAAAAVLVLRSGGTFDRTEPQLRLELVTKLAPSSSEALIASPMFVSRDSRGHILLSCWGNASSTSKDLQTISVFDSTGRFVRFLAGRGEGPGEVIEPTAVIVLPGDSLAVFSTARISLFGPDFKYVRSWRPDTLVMGEYRRGLPKDGLIPTGSMFGDRGGGFPVYVRDLEGRTRATLRMKAEESYAYAAGAGSGKWWLGFTTRKDPRGYHLRLVDSTGKTLREIVQRPPWWVVRDTTVGVYPDPTRPEHVGSFVEGISVDSAGTIFVVGRIPQKAKGGGPVTYGGIVEAIDPKTGKVYRSNVVPDYPRGFIDARHIATDGLDENDEPTVVIWRVELK